MPTASEPPPLPQAAASTHSTDLTQDPHNLKISGVIQRINKITEENPDTVCDFSFGNPHEPPSSKLVSILSESLKPKTVDYYAYRENSPKHREILAESAGRRYSFTGLTPEDVFLTTGNFAGLAIALQTVVEPEDNVIYMEPGWFLYYGLILNARAQPRAVSMPLHESPDDDFADMRVFLDAIDDSTKMIIFNQPHNPSGKVYSRAWLEQFSENLLDITRARGRPIYILADEAYSDFVFDGAKHETIANIYPYTFLAYTYNKMTLAPSQRMGYLMLSPLMPGREALYGPIFSVQMTLTWCFPNAMMMESIPQLEAMRDEFDFSTMLNRRDRMQSLLEEIGYEMLVKPKGAFYMLFKSPMPDDEAFCLQLAKRKVLVLPGAVFLTPGCFRICLTASDDMIERCAGGFRECYEEAKRESQTKNSSP